MKKIGILLLGVLLIYACNDDDDNGTGYTDVTQIVSYNLLCSATSAEYYMSLNLDDLVLFNDLPFRYFQPEQLGWDNIISDTIDVDLHIYDASQTFASKEQVFHRDSSYLLFGIGFVNDTSDWKPQIVTTAIKPSAVGQNMIRFANFIPEQDTLYFTVNELDSILVRYGKISGSYSVDDEDVDYVLITSTSGDTVYTTSENFIQTDQNYFIVASYLYQKPALHDLDQQTAFLLIE